MRKGENPTDSWVRAAGGTQVPCTDVGVQLGRTSGVPFGACLVRGSVKHPSEDGKARKEDLGAVCILMSLSKVCVLEVTGVLQALL